jgi:DNA-binding transcriptional regulator GbsR (MarR family)
MDNNSKIRISINQDVRRHVINACIQWARIRGYSDSVGLLRGLSVTARDPVSLDDLVTETGYSKSTVSSNMNLLEDLGLVARVVIPGDKRHIYALIIDPERIMANTLDMIERVLSFARLWRELKTRSMRQEQMLNGCKSGRLPSCNPIDTARA